MSVHPAHALALGFLVWGAAAGARPPDDEIRITRLEDRREPVVTLARFLDSPLPGTRARACLAIGRIAGPAPDERAAQGAVGLLSPRLRQDASPRVRESAAFALGLLATPNAGAPVAGLLVAGAEVDGGVRAAAVEALGRCAPDAHPAAMARALRDADPRVVEAALLAVWHGAGSPHLDRILELSGDADPEVRWRAAYALMRLMGAPTAGRTPASTAAHLSEEERDRVLWAMIGLTHDPDPRVMLPALRALGTRSGNSVLAASAGDALFQGLSQPDPRARVEALRSLGIVLAGAGRCDGLAVYLQDSHPHVRVTAIQSAGRILDPPSLLALLEPVFASPSVWERSTAYETAIAALREAGRTQSALGLIERCRADSAWVVRYTGGAGLAELCAGQASKALRDSLEERLPAFLADDPRVAKSVAAEWVAARSARSADPAALLSEIEPLLANRDDVLRALTLDGLERDLEARSGGPDSLPAARVDSLLTRVAALAGDPSPDVRTSLIALLGRCVASARSARASALLFDIATGDSDRRIRSEAIRTLRDRAPEGSPERARAAQLEPGPQETGWSEAQYASALAFARSAREAILETGTGQVRVRLFGASAPLTVANFARLAARGFFDHGAWHRVVPDFVTQDGCPRADGWGGPGYAIRCEIDPHHYEPGTLGMALSGKDTGGSQFFFTLSDQPHLDGHYTIFGRVLEGRDVLDRISQGDPITRVEILFDGPTPAELR